MAKCSLDSSVSRLTIHVLIFEEGEHGTLQLAATSTCDTVAFHRLCTTLGVLFPSPAFLVILN